MANVGFGGIGLWCAVAAALVGASAGVFDRRRLARVGLVTAALALTAALLRLGAAFVLEEWQYEYVADHTRSGIGVLPRLAGLWAGPEGSLLLWACLLAWAVVIAEWIAPHGARVVALLGGLLTSAFAAIVAFLASPFTVLAVPPIDGLGLQPILEHPAMVWHPPLLYAGLVGMFVPSLVAVASSENQIAPRWWRVPLGLLAAGLLSGARWAHAELGWGGFWAWDPIESAGLAAWLAAAAALHLGRHPVGAPRTVRAINVLPGIAALWATTLTRVGLVSSVHAFADRPALRVALLAVATTASMTFLALVVFTSGPRPSSASPTTRGAQGAAWVLLVAALYVGVGTYEPLIEAATTGDRVAIAGTFFARLMWPLAVVGGALAVRADRQWIPAVIGGVLGAIAVPLTVGPFGVVLASSGGAIAGSAISLVGARRPGALAHIGCGVILIGIAGSLGTTVSTVRLAVDTPTDVDGITLTHRSVAVNPGDVISTAVASVEVNGVVVQPALNTFHLRGVSTAEVAHRSLGLDEVQVVLTDADNEQARYQVNRFPRLHLLWFGGLVLVAGLLGQSSRRLRARSRSTVEPPSFSAAGGGSDTTGGA